MPTPLLIAVKAVTGTFPASNGMVAAAESNADGSLATDDAFCVEAGVLLYRHYVTLYYVGTKYFQKPQAERFDLSTR